MSSTIADLLATVPRAVEIQERLGALEREKRALTKLLRIAVERERFDRHREDNAAASVSRAG